MCSLVSQNMGAGLRSLLGAPLPSRHESLDPLRWFVTPIEEHAFIRRVVTTAQLNDVAVLGDGRTVIVVGRQGALLRSTNSGATWISIADSVIWNDSVVEGDTGGGQLPSVKPRPSLESVVASADGSLAVAVGSAGTVLTSEDSGQTWIERNSGSSANLTSVAFDAGTGRTIAVGREGTVLVSGDGGQSWTARKSGSSVWLSSVAFNAGHWAGHCRGRARHRAHVRRRRAVMDWAQLRIVGVAKARRIRCRHWTSHCRG